MEIRLPTAKQSELILNKMQYPSDKLQIISINKDKLILWYDTARKIVYAVDSTLPQLQQEILYASYDYGETWKAVYSANGYGIKRFYTLKSGYHLTFTTNSRMYRVRPDFTSSAMWQGAYVSTPLGNSLSIAEKDGIIMFAEYGTVNGTVYNVYKSTNDGVSWEVAYAGTNVRHWHSLQVDPYTGHWWLCGGDTNEQSRIIRSKDDGDTWVELGSGSQDYRSCGLTFTQKEVIWGSDAAASTPKILKSNKDNWLLKEVGETPLKTTTLGMAKTIDGLALGWTRVEATGAQQDTAIVWLSDGTNIKTIVRLAVRPENSSGVTQPGISTATAIDDENRWFANCGGTVLSGAIGFVLPFGLFQ